MDALAANKAGMPMRAPLVLYCIAQAIATEQALMGIQREFHCNDLGHVQVSNGVKWNEHQLVLLKAQSE